VGPRSAHNLNEQGRISLAYLPPAPGQTRLALAWGAALLLGFAALTPFARKPLPQFNSFIPALDAVIFVTDIMTAGLFFAHFTVTRSRALLALACGFLFSALIVVAHALTFPGALSPIEQKVIRANLRIYLFWHVGLPATLFAYLWLRDRDRAGSHAPRSAAFVGVCSFAGVLALVLCLVWLAAVGDEVLPYPLGDFDLFSGRVVPWLIGCTIMICAAALCALWVFRRSLLDQWLMVVVIAAMAELAISGRFGWHVSHSFQSRFTVGFYAGRILFSLLTSTFILVALLAETRKLYAGVARADMLGRIVDASKTLSGEMELPKLIGRLMTIALEITGGGNGALILASPDEYLVRARAHAVNGLIDVTLCSDAVTRNDLPQAPVDHAIRTQELVLLDDRSVLCLPMVKQTKLVGLLYLENESVPFVFTPERIATLQLFASQAAISLENAALYTDLQLQVGLLQRLPVAAWTLKPDGTPDFVNHVWLDFAGQTLDFVRSHPEAWMSAVHHEDREAAASRFWEGVHSGEGFTLETRSLRTRDQTYRWHLQQAVVLRDSEGKVVKFVGTTTDIDDQKRTEAALRQAQAELARINRVTTLGELAASLAHELSQPISGAMVNAGVTLRTLGDQPDLDGVRTALTRILRDTQRAADIINNIRSQFKRDAPKRQPIDVNEINRETAALLRDEAGRYNILVRTELAADLPRILGDRVQLRQVTMNLIINGIEAVKQVDGMREIIIRSGRSANGQVLVSVTDTGAGVSPQLAERIFDAFFTTKPQGTGMGLRICRSIIESHGGRIWAASNEGAGATFSFSLPESGERVA
jgi:PAS domain S-box-containing protein